MKLPQLVLSLFPGIGLLDRAFEEDGFVVVRGPDVLWGGDIRNFHPPAGRFDGVIGGPPCQAFSQLAYIVKAMGKQPKFGNLIPEFERCVGEAAPDWFIMEEVPRAPLPKVVGYGVHTFSINNRQFGATQNRVRRISFGSKGKKRILNLDVVVFENEKYESAACGGHSGSLSRVDRRRVGKPGSIREYRTGTSCLGENYKTAWAFQELKRKQGLPEEFDIPGFTVAAKCQAVGNGVPLPMGLAIAKGVKEAIEAEEVMG
jgi:DNA (cytosine-5)-methyltransferase 1